MEKTFECFMKVEHKQDWVSVLEGKKARSSYQFVGWSSMPDFRSDFVISHKIRGRFLYVETKSGSERYTLHHNV